MRRLPLTAALWAVPGTALAAGSAGPDLAGSWFKLLAGLAVVLGLVYLLYAISRKGLGRLPGAKGSRINIVEVRSLGPKKGLCLVEVGGRELLLGFGPDRVECLAQLGAAAPEKDFARRLDALRDGEGR